MNTNETSLQVIENKGILAKIVNLFKKILGKDKSSYIVSSNDTDNSPNNKNSFFKTKTW